MCVECCATGTRTYSLSFLCGGADTGYIGYRISDDGSLNTIEMKKLPLGISCTTPTVNSVNRQYTAVPYQGGSRVLYDLVG